MKILAAGVRYDQNKVIQAVVVITDEDGLGHPDHLNPHKLHAAKLGHGWLNIDPETYGAFKHRADLEAHFAEAVK
jgi:LmbE family N-acetylglucosaminyl deacetylase